MNDEISETKKTSYIVRRRGEREGRPIEGITIKAHCSVRIQAHIKEQIRKDHGTIQRWVDLKVSDDYERK